MDSKSQLRSECKNIRKTLDIENKSKNLTKKIRELELYKFSEHVMLYYPLKYEINLLELLNDNKKFYLPKVSENDLLVCPYVDKLTISEYNIKEPCSTPENPDILDLIIVPALAADRRNFRLGYGKGFYDRFISKYPDIKTVTPIPKELVFDVLPTNEFDKKIDIVIID